MAGEQAKKVREINLDELLERSKKIKMTARMQREQCISWAYGTMRMHNPDVTREMVEAAYDRMHAGKEYPR